MSPSSSVSASISPSESASPSVSPSVPPSYDGTITLVLVHNKSSQGNFDQIETLKTKLTQSTETIGGVGEESELIHYEIIGLTQDYEIKIFQIVPYGVTPPSNFSDLISSAVFYGTGDENKTGTHPRFFNLGLKRGADYGSNFILTIDDVSNLNSTSLSTQLGTLIASSTTALFENLAGQILTPQILEVGELDESMDFATALADLITRLTNQGFTSGSEES